MLEQIHGGPLAERRPNIYGMVSMRKEALRVLHGQQLTLLRQWRQRRQSGKQEEAEALLPSLLLTVNAIASGLGTTG
jgi:phosphoenolpyruvate carboxylase